MKPLIEKMVTTHAFKGKDVREAIDKTLKEVCRHHPSTDDVYNIFKKNFGDALVLKSEDSQQIKKLGMASGNKCTASRASVTKAVDTNVLTDVTEDKDENTRN